MFDVVEIIIFWYSHENGSGKNVAFGTLQMLNENNIDWKRIIIEKQSKFWSMKMLYRYSELDDWRTNFVPYNARFGPFIILLYKIIFDFAKLYCILDKCGEARRISGCNIKGHKVSPNRFYWTFHWKRALSKRFSFIAEIPLEGDLHSFVFGSADGL